MCIRDRPRGHNPIDQPAPRNLRNQIQYIQGYLDNPDLRVQFVRFCQSRNYEITTWELFIASFHLFVQRLRRAGQEG